MFRNRWTTWMGACFGLSLAGAALATDPPRFVPTVFGAFGSGGITEGTALNPTGWSAGRSGANYVSDQAYLAAPTGTMTPLDSAGVFQRSEGLFINSSGLIVGDGEMPGTQTYKLFRWTAADGLSVIGSLGGDVGQVTDMNEHGDVVGWWYTTTQFVAHSILYTPERGLIDFDELTGHNVTINDISNDRTIVGSYWDNGSSVSHAFTWRDGQLTELGTLGGPGAQAYYAASTGAVVGSASTAGGQLHAFRYTPGGGMQDLHTLAYATSSQAGLITDSGTVIEIFSTAVGQGTFCYRDGIGMVDIGLPDVTGWDGINRANHYDEMVGGRVDPNTYQVHALYFTPDSGVHDLDGLVIGHLPAPLEMATAINDAGQVLATGSIGVRPFTALLTPVRTGDLNCDRQVNFNDINDFVQALSDAAGYTAAHPTCTILNGDINGDGLVNFADINPFVGLLSGGS